jgi:hypothetical protein
VKATNQSRVGVANLASLRAAGSKPLYGQPTAEEISRLTFAKLRDIRIHAQELRNRFARLLNRGSSLE